MLLSVVLHLTLWFILMPLFTPFTHLLGPTSNFTHKVAYASYLGVGYDIEMVSFA